MKKTIFEKAEEIIRLDKIEHTGSGNDREFYKVAGVLVELRQFQWGPELHCSCRSCRHCSINSVHKPLCCFKTALIKWLK